MRDSVEDVVSVAAKISALNRYSTRQSGPGRSPNLYAYVICASNSSSLS